MSSFELFRCPYRQAKDAAEAWHYTGTLPAAGLDCYGVTEAGRFVGVVAFGHGANYHLADPFGLRQSEVRELVRVALSDRRLTPTSRIVAAALHRLHSERREVRAVVSYADTAQGHIGTLYQAGNWFYLGTSGTSRSLWLHGRRYHARSVYDRYGTNSLARLRAEVDPNAFATVDLPKHKYAWAWQAWMRRRLRRMHRPYPRAVKESQATRPVSDREGHVRSVLTAPKPSLSCGCPVIPTGDHRPHPHRGECRDQQERPQECGPQAGRAGPRPTRRRGSSDGIDHPRRDP